MSDWMFAMPCKSPVLLNARRFTSYRMMSSVAGTPANAVPYCVLYDGSMATGGAKASGLQELNNNTTAAIAAHQVRI